MTDDTQIELDNLKNNLSQITLNEKKGPIHLGLILGPKESGKTSLLNQTPLQHTQTTSRSGTECNTWSNKNSLFIELPETIVGHDKIIPAYLKIITRHCRKKHLDSLSVCLNIYDSMMQKPMLFVQQLIAIRKRLAFITKIVGKTRLFIIFTHMDKVAGFCHSFEEVDDAYGYSFTRYPNHESLLKQNDKQYRELVKHLHLTLIKRLHETKDELTRYLIREFPIQMESLNNMVRACIKHLAHDNLIMSSVFFTSAQQGNAAHDRLSANITQTYALAISSAVPQSSRDTAFFVSGCINKITRYQAPEQTIFWSRSTIAAGTTCLIIGLGIGIHHLRSNYLLNQANQELYIYQHSQADNLDQFTGALEHLTKAESAVGDLSHFVPLTHINRYQKQVEKQYQKGIKNNFLTIVKSQLEQVLNQQLTPIQSYHTLKTYLMLGDPKHIDQVYLENWLSEFWKKNQFLEQPRLNKLLKLAIKPPFNGITLNQSVIENIRSYLTALPEDYFYYTLFEESKQLEKASHPFQYFTLKEINVPYAFQKQHFKTIYNDLIPAFAKQLEQDDFVLGHRVGESLNTVIQSTYLKHYKAWWQTITQKSMPLTFQSYAEAQQVFTQFASEDSSFARLRKLIQSNTVPYINPQTVDEHDFNQWVAHSFTSFNLFTDNQANLIQPIFSDLRHYFITLNQSTDGSETAFNIAKARFINRQVDPISQLYNLNLELPFPLNEWVKKLSNNAWNLILQDAQNHINNEWKRLVYTQYEDRIADLFPFNPRSNKEVSKHHFINFFGQEGRLTQFFDYYLRPFIDTSSAKWHVKALDGLQLPIHQQTITELIRANVIREMFFKDSDDLPDITFTLHAIALEPIVKRFTISVNGQSLSEEQHQKQSFEFKWPGQQNEEMTQLLVESIYGKTYQVSESGFWGLFKLFSKATLTSINNDTQNYQLILDVNGNAAKFLLNVKTPLNPFIPGVLENFKLPKELA